MELEYTLSPDLSVQDIFIGLITLTCHGAEGTDDPIETLWFSTARPFRADNIQGASLNVLDGDLHGLWLDQPLSPGHSTQITLRNDTTLLPKHTDRPYGIFGSTCSGQIILATVAQPPLYWDTRPAPVPRPWSANALVPQPEALRPGPDQTFDRPDAIHWLPEAGSIGDTVDISRWSDLAQRFARFTLSSEFGWPLAVQTDSTLPVGGYNLAINAHGGQLTARDEAGVHAALSTLVQWFCGEQVQTATISDQPRFYYRGLHLDVSRHFVPMDEVKRIIRLCALYKINHLHWHLTDDEGWRLEIKRYPQITDTAAWRGPRHIMPPQMGTGGEPHGGYYSQEEVRETVQLANALGVTLIPEIDVPGHARALIRALPELVEAADRSQYRSVQYYHDNVLNPALPETWTIVTGILDEVADLFPDAELHLGSDEVPDGVWEKSPAAQDKARSLGLDSVRGLHGWFMRALEDYCWTQHGRRISGWEEVIADYAVSTNTTVYSWQGVDAGLNAAEKGYSVVMTPAQHCYLDLAFTSDPADPGYYWAGNVSAQDAYLFEPFEGIKDAPQRTKDRFRGIQACLWSELLDSADKRAFMLLPRLPAVAERAWSCAGQRDFSYFQQRCLAQQILWQQDGWHYRAPSLGW